MIIRYSGTNKSLSIIRHTVSTLLPTFPCGPHLNIVIYISVIAYVGETQTPKFIQLHLTKRCFHHPAQVKRLNHSAIAATNPRAFCRAGKYALKRWKYVFFIEETFPAARKYRTYREISPFMSTIPFLIRNNLSCIFT